MRNRKYSRSRSLRHSCWNTTPSTTTAAAFRLLYCIHLATADRVLDCLANGNFPCTNDYECELAYPLGNYPDGCGTAWCENETGECVYESWVEESTNAACVDSHILCGGNSALCTNGPAGVADEDYEGNCVANDGTECEYRWCVPSKDTTPVPSGECCMNDRDCIVAAEIGRPLATDCGNVLCNATTNRCEFSVHNESEACQAGNSGYYSWCSGDDSNCNSGPPNTMGECKGWEGMECVYSWCPLGGGTQLTTTSSQVTTQAPPTTQTTTSQATTQAPPTTQVTTQHAVTTGKDTSPAAPGECCVNDKDCIMAVEIGRPNVTDCGNVVCNTTTNRCEFDAWVASEACQASNKGYYVWCSGDDSKCNSGPPNTMGECKGWVGMECVYSWCPLGGGTQMTTSSQVTTQSPPTTQTTTSQATTQAPPTTQASTTAQATTQASPTTQVSTTAQATTQASPTTLASTTAQPTTQAPPTTQAVTTQAPSSISEYICSAAHGKTPCTSTDQCIDAMEETGMNSACGEAMCNSDTGACNFDSNNDECEQFSQCFGFDGICYKGPTKLNFGGFCSGYEQSECVYAWCPGDLAPSSPPLGTSTTTTTTTVVVNGRTLTEIVIQMNSNDVTSGLKLGAGYHKELRAMGRFTDNLGMLEDITTAAKWTSSDEMAADFTFPGLLETKFQSEVQLTAALEEQLSFMNRIGTANLTVSLSGVSKSINLVVDLHNSISCDVRQVGMKVLVIYDTGYEDELWAIHRALGHVGIPYEEFSVIQLQTSVSFRDEPCRGSYQALIVTSSSLRNLLQDKHEFSHEAYCRDFGVRTVYWNGNPSQDLGFDENVGISSGGTIQALVTAAGQQIFSYLSTDTIKVNADTNMGQPLPGSTPLLVDQSNNNYALAVEHTLNGMESLTLTFSSDEDSHHIIVLSYGIVNWATRGTFIGNRRVYVSAQMDDYFIDDDVWLPSTPCGTPTDQTGAKYRIDAQDLDAILAYQEELRNDPITADFRFDMVYNGLGAGGTEFSPDTLTPPTLVHEAEFKWISHGFEHNNQDNTNYLEAYNEVLHNQIVAKDLGFTLYKDANMVTGQVSGLKNPEFLRAAADLGVKFLVTDTSRAEVINGTVYSEEPGDNRGLWNWLESRVYMIPRHANDLYYNVGLREELVAQYNCIYNSAYDIYGVIDIISDELLNYLLQGQRYPWMFHQINLRSYVAIPENKTLMLIQELLDSTFTKYKALYNLPILSPMMDDLGHEVIWHTEIKDKDVAATFATGIGMVIQARQQTTTPVTGFGAPGYIEYGGQKQAYVNLNAGESLFVPLGG